MGLNDAFKSISWKSVIFGAAFFVFIAVYAYQNHIDYLIPFAALGPLYIGYKAQDKIQGFILGVLGSTPLLYAAFYGYLGPITESSTLDINILAIIMIVIILLSGGIIAYIGAYYSYNKAKAIEMKERQNSSGSKNKPVNKKDKYKLEDTGSVTKNIVNMFKPKK